MCHAGVASRGAEVGVPQQLLDHADVGASLEQMRREAVAKRMGRDLAREPRLEPGEPKRLAQRVRAERASRPRADEQIRQRRALDLPIRPQCSEQHRRQHDIARLVSLAATHMNHPARRVDVRHLERARLRDAKPSAVHHHRDRSVLRRPKRPEQHRNLLGGEHPRHRARLRRPRKKRHFRRAPERLVVQELDRGEVKLEPRRPDAARRKLLDVLPKLHPPQLGRRLHEPPRKRQPIQPVHPLRPLRVSCQGQIPAHLISDESHSCLLSDAVMGRR